MCSATQHLNYTYQSEIWLWFRWQIPSSEFITPGFYRLSDQIRKQRDSSNWAFCYSIPGSAQRWRTDTLSRKEEVLWRVQVSQMQKEVDEWKLLGQYGTGVYQVSYQRVPSQTGAAQLSLHFLIYSLHTSQSVYCASGSNYLWLHASPVLTDKQACIMYTHTHTLLCVVELLGWMWYLGLPWNLRLNPGILVTLLSSFRKSCRME